MWSRSRSPICSSLLLLGLLLTSRAQDGAAPSPATDPAYRLNRGDRVAVAIFGESDLGAAQVIDWDGRVRLPLIGTVTLAGQTVREAEAQIERAYREQEFLKRPQVTLSLQAYAPREVTVLGAVRSPGTFQFPPDANNLDLRDLIARLGGLTPVAKGTDVSVTRRQPDGTETSFVVDIERAMSGRGKTYSTPVLIYPEDRIFIPERLF